MAAGRVTLLHVMAAPLLHVERNESVMAGSVASAPGCVSVGVGRVGGRRRCRGRFYHCPGTTVTSAVSLWRGDRSNRPTPTRPPPQGNPHHSDTAVSHWGQRDPCRLRRSGTAIGNQSKAPALAMRNGRVPSGFQLRWDTLDEWSALGTPNRHLRALQSWNIPSWASFAWCGTVKPSSSGAPPANGPGGSPLRCNPVVSCDALIEAVWAGNPPDSARTTLHSYLSNLRSQLGESLVRSGDGYRVDATMANFDALRFEDLVDASRGLIAGRTRGGARAASGRAGPVGRGSLWRPQR